mmetsp:Transcript_19978/g.60384  ORF Transcript_19978/g.60384 Transcript_19978/m.60384 type:complete len:323 (+) Transcript_19978:411-1379(+)
MASRISASLSSFSPSLSLTALPPLWALTKAMASSISRCSSSLWMRSISRFRISSSRRRSSTESLMRCCSSRRSASSCSAARAALSAFSLRSSITSLRASARLLSRSALSAANSTNLTRRCSTAGSTAGEISFCACCSRRAMLAMWSRMRSDSSPAAPNRTVPALWSMRSARYLCRMASSMMLSSSAILAKGMSFASASIFITVYTCDSWCRVLMMAQRLSAGAYAPMSAASTGAAGDSAAVRPGSFSNRGARRAHNSRGLKSDSSSAKMSFTSWGMMLRTPLACSSVSSPVRVSCSPWARFGSGGKPRMAAMRAARSRSTSA